MLFGSRDRQLFGLHEPATTLRQRRGVVLCAPWGQEYLRSHRSLKLLADRFAQVGCDVLRFDYYGTGDSAGHFEDVTVDGMVDDAVMAVEELEDLAQVRHVTLVGLRLGAAVAAMAAARVRSVDRLVLWDPVSDGARYVEEMSDGRDGAGTVEVLGFQLTSAFRAELVRLPSTVFASSPSETLLVASEESLEHERLGEILAEGNRVVDYEVRLSPRCWIEEGDFGAGVVPAEILDRIAAW